MNRKPPPRRPCAPAASAANDDLDAFEPPEFEPARPRPRFDGWTPNRQAEFIQALGESACVEDACRAVGMSVQSAYALRARADAVSFRNAWEAALDYGVRRLSDAALSRAINGVAVPVFYRGEQIGEKRYYDERLAMFLMRYRDPLRYGKWLDRFEHRGHPEGFASELHEAKHAVREDAGLCVDDVPKRFSQRLREIAAKVLRMQRADGDGR
ncbi:MAG TPA: hypothetical protein VEB68_10985 [Croceibacterium sp.]|nr:hypothetical protein [Croceibacterium sp.]